MVLVVILVFPQDVAVPVVFAQQPTFAGLERAALGRPVGRLTWKCFSIIAQIYIVYDEISASWPLARVSSMPLR